MKFLKFNMTKCDLCKECIKKCPFMALTIEEQGIEVGETCRMCGVCIKVCPQKAICFEQKAGTANKKEWKGILIYAEQSNGVIHPVVYELIGEAKKMAAKVNYPVFAVVVGPKYSKENGRALLGYGVDKVYVYEDEGFEGFKADCYTDAVADCIATIKPSVVLIGATSLGRSLAPRLSTRFHTGLTADCTKLVMKENTDLVQIRPAFGGNIMAQILIADARPQFATVRYKVMEAAKRIENPQGLLINCEVTKDLVRSRITVKEKNVLHHTKSIEEEEVLIVAGRGVKSKKELEMLKELAELLGGALTFTRPMVEAGYGDTAHQIGLSGRTVKPKLIITCGVSGAIQFAAGMKEAECIIAIDINPDALIFNIANYCIAKDFTQVVPGIIKRIKGHKEVSKDGICI